MALGKPVDAPRGSLRGRPQHRAASSQPLPLPGSVSWVWPNSAGLQPSWLASRWIWDRQLGCGVSRSEEMEAGDGPWAEAGAGIRSGGKLFGGGFLGEGVTKDQGQWTPMPPPILWVAKQMAITPGNRWIPWQASLSETPSGILCPSFTPAQGQACGEHCPLASFRTSSGTLS